MLFEDEKLLLTEFLGFQVGQNGSHLSSDLKKIILMAKALVYKPKILIADETAFFVSNIDKQFYLRCFFNSLKESGIITFNKDLTLLFNYQSALLLREGEIVEQGHPKSLIEQSSSQLYQIVSKDDVRTLRKLENQIEKNIQRLEIRRNHRLEDLGSSQGDSKGKKSNQHADHHAGAARNSVFNMKLPPRERSDSGSKDEGREDKEKRSQMRASNRNIEANVLKDNYMEQMEQRRIYESDFYSKDKSVGSDVLSPKQTFQDISEQHPTNYSKSQRKVQLEKGKTARKSFHHKQAALQLDSL